VYLNHILGRSHFSPGHEGGGEYWGISIELENVKKSDFFYQFNYNLCSEFTDRRIDASSADKKSIHHESF
jgi:hypothetical protein